MVASGALKPPCVAPLQDVVKRPSYGCHGGCGGGGRGGGGHGGQGRGFLGGFG